MIPCYTGKVIALIGMLFSIHFKMTTASVNTLEQWRPTYGMRIRAGITKIRFLVKKLVNLLFARALNKWKF